jgi:hypothetical protein
MSRNQEIAVLVFIIVLGVGARWWGLGSRSYSFDEMQTAVTASQPPVKVAELAMDQERKAPLFHYLMYPWLSVSRDETWARMPPAFFGALMIPFAWLLAREAVPKRKSEIALLTALIVALNPALIFYSQQVRMYTALGAASLLNMYFFLRAARAFAAGESEAQGRTAAKMTAAFLVTGLVSSLLHPFYALLAAGEAMTAAVWLWRKWDKALGLAFIAIFAAGPGLIMRGGEMSEAGGAFRAVNVLDPFNVFRHMAILYPTPSPMTGLRDAVDRMTSGALPWHVALTVGAGALIFGALFIAGVFSRQVWRVKAALLLFLLAPLGIMLALSPWKPSFFNPRFMMNVYPAFSLFVALGMTALPWRGARPTAAALVIALSLVSIGYYNFDRNYDNRHTREAAAYLREHAEVKHIIHTSCATYFSSYFYNRGALGERILAPELLPLQEGGEMVKACPPGIALRIEDVVRPREEFFFVLPEPTRDRSEEKGADRALGRFIGGNYNVLERKPFFGVVVYRVKRLS